MTTVPQTPTFKWDGALLIFSLWLAGTAAIAILFPAASRSLAGWVLLVAAAPLGLLSLLVMQALGEGAAQLLCKLPPIRQGLAWVERVTAGCRFSWLRIGIALIPATLLLGLLLLAVVFGAGADARK